MVRSLVREHLREFRPYKSARSEIRSAEIFLDANELAFGSPVDVDALPLHRYPDPFQDRLRSRLAAHAGVAKERIFVGVGSDEIIDLLIRLVCEPGEDRILVLEPTYGVYSVAAAVNKVEVVSAELDAEFQINVKGAERLLDRSIKMTFCCSPNNPTGNLLRREDVLALCAQECGLVVVDEAYIDFADGGSSLVKETAAHGNLVVLRTMSKSFGLAGIRLGYCIGDPDLVEYLLKIKSPYSINTLTSHVALSALESNGALARNVQAVRESRAWLRAALASAPGVERIYPSDANFLLVRFRDAESVYKKLLSRGIIVRRRSESRLSSCLRITVGTREENQLLLEALRES